MAISYKRCNLCNTVNRKPVRKCVSCGNSPAWTALSASENAARIASGIAANARAAEIAHRLFGQL